jgi:uncharacterized protein (DUF58 family)
VRRADRFSPLQPLRAWLALRARAWALRRQGSDEVPFTLERRRIYILPTRFGVIYVLAVFAMLLASMNYNNSSGFALTFLLASLGFVTMFHCHRNLAGVVVEGVTFGEAYAGLPLALHVGCGNPSAVTRHALTLECDQQRAAIATVPAGGRAAIELEIPTQHRGVLRPQRLVLSTRFPFGLFRAWSWLHVPVEAIVYPRPAGAQELPGTSAIDSGSLEKSRAGDEDFRGFRDYRPGDSLRHVAWKAVARGAPLLVKDLSGAAVAPQMLEFEAVRTRDTEQRLSQLAKWVLLAERRAATFGLGLPQQRIAPARGIEQRRRCLTALARFGIT